MYINKRKYLSYTKFYLHMNNYENEEMGEKMNKRIALYLLGFCTLMIVSFTWIFFSQKESLVETNELTATVISVNDSQITMQDHNNIIYTFPNKNVNADIGSSIVIEYSGILDKNTEIQESNIVSYIPSTLATDENGIPMTWLDHGIFSKYYILANNKLKTLSLDEKIGQLFLVRYPDTDAKEALQTYQFGGYLFFEKDFTNKTETEVKNMINELQEISKIPLLTAVDEEGGKNKSEAGMSVEMTAMLPEEVKERKFYLDDEFTIFLKETDKDIPYFVAMINDITKFG